jgi:hypothetical protein
MLSASRGALVLLLLLLLLLRGLMVRSHPVQHTMVVTIMYCTG